MQPSGQAWAQVEQPVQRSSNQSRLVRARGDNQRVSSGNWTVTGWRKACFSVWPMPLAMPMPYTRHLISPAARNTGDTMSQAQHSEARRSGEVSHKRAGSAGPGVGRSGGAELRGDAIQLFARWM